LFTLEESVTQTDPYSGSIFESGVFQIGHKFAGLKRRRKNESAIIRVSCQGQ
jgi:hypothetical protein